MNAVAGWGGAPQPVAARELLPERADGRHSAVTASTTRVTRPRADAGLVPTETLDAYLDSAAAPLTPAPENLFIQIRPLSTGSDHRLHRP